MPENRLSKNKCVFTIENDVSFSKSSQKDDL